MLLLSFYYSSSDPPTYPGLLYFSGLMLLFTLICLFFFVPYGVLIAYYLKAWKKIPVYSPIGTGTPSFNTRISVLVPARNEELNIGACLDSLSRQSYPKDLFQVIVIDDHSTDRTADIVKQRQTGSQTAQEAAESRRGTGMEVVCIRLADHEPPAATGSQTGKAYKKFAIETAIGTSTGELIVTTDADCRFLPDWLTTIAGFYEETGARFIAAPVKIGLDGGSSNAPPEQKGSSFLAIFQTLDFISLQGITGAAVYKKFHSMCNGANLAYAKDAFYEVDGFRGIDDIPSGDDMLLMHKIYKKYPDRIFFLKSRETIVSTREEISWKGFVGQRIRWASKADRYDDKRIFWVLLLVYVVNLVFLGSLLASFWNSRYLWIFLFLLILKTTIEFPFVRSVAVFFSQQRLMPWFPVMQPFHIVYTVLIGWLGKFGSYRWKGRKSV